MMRAQFKFFSFHFCFHNILTTMFYVYHASLNSFQDRLTPDLSILCLLAMDIAKNTRSIATLIITLIGHNSDLSLSYIKGCRSINKQFSIHSFLDWEGHHTFSYPNTDTLYRPKGLHSLICRVLV